MIIGKIHSPAKLYNCLRRSAGTNISVFQGTQLASSAGSVGKYSVQILFSCFWCLFVHSLIPLKSEFQLDSQLHLIVISSHYVYTSLSKYIERLESYVYVAIESLYSSALAIYVNTFSQPHTRASIRGILELIATVARCIYTPAIKLYSWQLRSQLISARTLSHAGKGVRPMAAATDIQLLHHEVGQNAEKNPSRYVWCDSRGACLDCTSSHHWAGIFSALKSLSLWILTPCSTGFGLLAGPWWDNLTEKMKI